MVELSDTISASVDQPLEDSVNLYDSKSPVADASAFMPARYTLPVVLLTIAPQVASYVLLSAHEEFYNHVDTATPERISLGISQPDSD